MTELKSELLSSQLKAIKFMVVFAGSNSTEFKLIVRSPPRKIHPLTLSTGLRMLVSGPTDTRIFDALPRIISCPTKMETESEREMLASNSKEPSITIGFVLLVNSASSKSVALPEISQRLPLQIAEPKTF